MAEDKHITDTGGEITVEDILDMDDLKAANVPLAMSNNSDTAHVVPTSDGGDIANFEFDKLFNLAGLEVEADCVVDLDERIRVANGAAVMGDEVRNALGAKLNLLDLEKFVLGLLGRDAMNGEAAFDVINKTEVFASLFSIEMTSWNPAGYVTSVRTLPSTLTSRCMRMDKTSLPVSAYLRRFLRKMMRGKHSRNL